MTIKRWGPLMAAGLSVVLMVGGGRCPLAAEQPPARDPETVPAAGGYAEPGACATCHEDVADALKRTPHGRTRVTTWDGAASCESCHGPGAAHVEAGGDVAKIRNFQALPAGEASAACLTCHERGERSHWQVGAHENRGLSCLSCHQIHHPAQPTSKLLAKKKSSRPAPLAT